MPVLSSCRYLHSYQQLFNLIFLQSQTRQRLSKNSLLLYFLKFSIPENNQSDVAKWVPLLQRSKFKYPLNLSVVHMFPSSKRLDAPVLCSFQEAPLASSVGKLPVPSYPMLLFIKQRYILSLSQLHVLGSEDILLLPVPCLRCTCTFSRSL